MRSVTFTAYQTAELIELPDDTSALQPTEVRGRAIVSLTSPGTELNWGYLGEKFPNNPGYAAVMTVEERGAEVTDVAVGDLVLTSGHHRSHLRAQARDVAKVPAGLAPEAAVFARLLGVGMSTLNTAAAQAPCRVLVTGLGPIGNLAAQVFANCGFQVTGVDPVENRRKLALFSGLTDVRESVDAPGPALRNHVQLHVECSGHEAAVLEGCRTVARNGEVFLVGVPWQRRTEIFAQELLHEVFHRYVILRSGWEWQVPRHPQDFRAHCIQENYVIALDWLRQGRIHAEGLAALYQPAQAQHVYQGLLNQSLPAMAAIFDWRG